MSYLKDRTMSARVVSKALIPLHVSCAPCEVAPTSAGQGLGLNIEAPALQDRNALLQLDVVLQG